MSVISIENASHYQWGTRCDGWHLHCSSQMSIIEERMPPNATETRHAHARATQFFYILLGDATMDIEVEGQTITHQLTKNDGITIEPMQVHQIHNRSAAELVFLVISSPPTDQDRINDP